VPDEDLVGECWMKVLIRTNVLFVFLKWPKIALVRQYCGSRYK